jgi:hypothetical protein
LFVHRLKTPQFKTGVVGLGEHEDVAKLERYKASPDGRGDKLKG